jgi:S1-C subfamily serine protease
VALTCGVAAAQEATTSTKPETTTSASSPAVGPTTEKTRTIIVKPGVDIDAAAKTVQKSLVLVEWSYVDENTTSERAGQGIVVSKDTVIVWGNLISENTPKEYVKRIEIRLPGKNFDTVKGTLLGRTQNRLFAYIRADKPLDAPPLDLTSTGTTKLGSRVFSVGMLDRDGGYNTTVGTTEVQSMQKKAFTLVEGNLFSLARGNSPVFDVTTGAIIGITAPPQGESFFMYSGQQSARIELIDTLHASTFFLFDEIKDAFLNIPDKPFESPRPWLGIGMNALAGLENRVRELYNIKERTGVVVGSTIANEAASKAGIKPLDIIVAINGKPFADSPVAEVMASQFQGAIDKFKPGEEIKLTVLRQGTRQEIPLTLGRLPKVTGEYQHVFESKVGVVTRDLAFWDTYERQLGNDLKGVVVALVKGGSVASLGQTPLRPGYIITRVNGQPVEGLKQFNELVKKEWEIPGKNEMVFVIIGPDNESHVCRIDLMK